MPFIVRPVIMPLCEHGSLPVKTALVHDWLIEMGEPEYCLETLCALFPDASLYTLFLKRDRISEAINHMAITTSVLQRCPGIASAYRYYLPFFPAVIEQFDLSGYDLVISNSHHVAKGVITQPDTLHLCYCHTPMPLIWAAEHTKRSLVTRLFRAVCVPYLRLWDVVSSQRVDHFATGTQTAADRIRKYYRREAAVIDSAGDSARFKQNLHAFIQQMLSGFHAQSNRHIDHDVLPYRV